MRLSLRLASTLLGALAPLSAHADADIRIGTGAGCSPAGTDIQAAIDSATPALGTVHIHIARNATYGAQQLDINGKNVRLIGGYADCLQAQPDATRTVLSGGGGGQNSVITIRGSTSRVDLLNLDIQNGDEVTSTNGYGGGLDVRGGPHPYVYLDNVRIHNSIAGYGGGISVANDTPSNQAAVHLILGQKTLITSNRGVQAGGGIYCADSTLSMIQPNTALLGNTAGNGSNDAPGGGLRIRNCVAKIATRDAAFGTVSDNTASGNGGGISITGERARLDLYNLQPNRPTTIARNTADGYGGGIEIGSSAKVYGFDLIIDGNTSRTGGGGVSVYDNDGDADCNQDLAKLLLQGGLNGAPAGAVNCAEGLDCNRVSNNLARSGDGTDLDAAAIRAEGDAAVFQDSGCAGTTLYGTRLDHNVGRSLVHVADSITFSIFDGVLMDSNTAWNLLRSDSAGRLEVFNSTIANNTLLLNGPFPGAVIRGDNSTLLKRSVVWQPGRPLFSVSGSLRADAVEYVLASDLTGAPPQPTNRVVTQSDIAFVDPAAGNFRLQAGSVALDYATPAAGQTRDHAARNIDIAQEANQFGSQDVGAYEKQSADGYNAAPAIQVAGPLTTREDPGGETFLYGFSLSDPNGDIDGALYVTAPADSTGYLDALYFAGVTATQLAANRLVIEGPLSRINSDTANFAGAIRYIPAPNFFGDAPIQLELSDQGNTGIGGALSAQATLMVQVLPVNDAPTLQVYDILRTSSDLGPQLVDIDQLSTVSLGPANEAGQSVQAYELISTQDPQGVLSSSPSLAPDGKLSFTLSGSPGVAQLSARVIDDGGTENGGVDRSAPATFDLRVSANSAGIFADGFEGTP